MRKLHGSLFERRCGVAAIDSLVYMKMRALTKSRRFENQGHHRLRFSHTELNDSGGNRKWSGKNTTEPSQS